MDEIDENTQDQSQGSNVKYDNARLAPAKSCIGPQRHDHVGHHTSKRKLAKAIDAVWPSLQFSMPAPALVTVNH